MNFKKKWTLDIMFKTTLHSQDLLNDNFVKIECEEENPSLPLFASITDFSEMRRTLVRRDSGKY